MGKFLKFFLSFFLFLSLFFFVFQQTSKAEGKNEKPQKKHIQVCSGFEGKESARCHAKVIVDGKGNPEAGVLPSGYGPAQFRGAYNLPASASGSPVIAIVDAYDHPNILNDLNVYSATFGVPSLPKCTGSVSSSSIPCFQKVNQNGGISYPSTNSGWALEIALDVETAHAVCPNCKILLVEANSSSYGNLMTAVDRAYSMGARIISNSYGSGEFSGELNYDSHFNKPGTVFTFSSGDSGYGVDYPAASRFVTAVGGTTLNVINNGGVYSYGGESIWSGAGSGCSAYESKPAFQTDINCSKRTVADVSADADPNTGAAVYDSVKYAGVKGWFQVGGTSLASPIVAGVYALAGGVGSGIQANSVPYSNKVNLYDILTGNNGSCGGLYLCTGMAGYDGPSGLGSPNGVGGF